MPTRPQFETEEQFFEALKDWFAGHAMQAILGGFIARGEGPTNFDEVLRLAKQSYRQADYMLVARKESQP